MGKGEGKDMDKHECDSCCSSSDDESECNDPACTKRNAFAFGGISFDSETKPLGAPDSDEKGKSTPVDATDTLKWRKLPNDEATSKPRTEPSVINAADVSSQHARTIKH